MTIHTPDDIIGSKRCTIMEADVFAQFERPFSGVTVRLKGFRQFRLRVHVIIQLTQSVIVRPAPCIIDGCCELCRVQLVSRSMQTERGSYRPSFLWCLRHRDATGRQQILRRRHGDSGGHHQFQGITAGITLSYDSLYQRLVTLIKVVENKLVRKDAITTILSVDFFHFTAPK